MTTTIFFVRHVEHEQQGRVQVSRMDGVEPSAEGRRQVGATAARLAGERLDAVRASPIERAQITARAIAERHGLEVQTDEDLNELDFGEWTGVSFDDLEADPRWRAWNVARDVNRAPGGETMLEAQARMMRAVETARRAHPEGRVALVSHGDPLKTALMHLLGLPLDNYDRFDIDPGSISAAVVGDWGARVLFLNERPA